MKTVHDAAQQLEAVLLRQLLREAKVFGSKDSGAHVYGDMFVDVIANAVAKAGGLGLAGAVERSLGGGAHEAPPAPHRGAGGLPAAAAGAAGLEEALLAGRGHVTSPFGPRRDPIDGHAAFHEGIDIAAPAGTPIHALAGGVVRAAGREGGYGLAVEVEGDDGVVTRYAHAEKLLVARGQRVEAGQVVADVGSTGRSTGPHVHVEARIHGTPVDPNAHAARWRRPPDPTSTLKVRPARVEDSGEDSKP